ncbi:MAG TPA: pyridoxamine 5'-phosphate oxidase family protein [Anaerolineales bacterium]|nr:pyridoxamine 5'-phosphate oxidase family protein [Anaerolineales bacterium]
MDGDFADLLLLSTMTLATQCADGEPHAADVYFTSDEEVNLYFFSDPISQHGLDISHNPRAAVTIHPENPGWEDIRGLQMRGEVQWVEPGLEWDLAWERYAAKFPFVAGLKAVVERNQLFVFLPRWIRLVDNRRGFGYQEEWIRSAEGQMEVSDSGWRRFQPENELPGETRG